MYELKIKQLVFFPLQGFTYHTYTVQTNSAQNGAKIAVLQFSEIAVLQFVGLLSAKISIR